MVNYIKHKIFDFNRQVNISAKADGGRHAYNFPEIISLGL